MPLILILVTGTKFFEVSGIAVPEWYAGAQENKLMTIVGLFFIGNMVETSMLSSGAFEITVNGEPVWSKMETGYLPSLEHLVSPCWFFYRLFVGYTDVLFTYICCILFAVSQYRVVPSFVE
eukprot:sb/3476043/